MCQRHSLPVGNYRNKSWCVQCKRDYDAAWYLRNKQKRSDWNSRHRSNVRDRLNAYKESTPCFDCGRVLPSYVMDFDHVRGEKSFNVSYLISNGLSGLMEEELKKCELVCSNCHRIRTHRRRSAIGNATLS